MSTLHHQVAPHRILPLLTSHSNSLPFQACLYTPKEIGNCSLQGDITIKPAIPCLANTHLWTSAISDPGYHPALLPNYGAKVSSWPYLPKFLAVSCSEDFNVSSSSSCPINISSSINTQTHTHHPLCHTSPLSNAIDSYSKINYSPLCGWRYTPKVASDFPMAPQSHHFPNQSHQT